MQRVSQENKQFIFDVFGKDAVDLCSRFFCQKKIKLAVDAYDIKTFLDSKYDAAQELTSF